MTWNSVSPLFLFISINSLLFGSPVFSNEDKDGEFGYSSGPNGPENWGNLNENWTTCNTGKLQSPIDLLSSRAVIRSTLGNIVRKYRAQNATIINRGHDIMVLWSKSPGKVSTEDNIFDLVQVHWHSPSEHTIGGERYPLEAHLVHKSKDNKITVMGLLYKYGKRDNFLAELEDDLKAFIKKEKEMKKAYVNKVDEHEAKEEEMKLELGKVNPMNLRLGSLLYYKYMGSLTSPPCTEGILWNVLANVRTVSKYQVHLLQEVVKDGYEFNARPIQEHNSRPVNRFKKEWIE